MRILLLVELISLVSPPDSCRAFSRVSFIHRSGTAGAQMMSNHPNKQPQRQQPRQPRGRPATRDMKTSVEGSSGAMGAEDREAGVPRLVVMDLDYTLWRPELYQMVGSPYTKDRDGKVRDRSGTVIDLFPGVREILLEVYRGDRFRGTKLAVASRASEQTWAREVMNLIELEPGLPMCSVFSSTQVYSGSKVRHFGVIRKDTGVPYEDMIFFDDWDQNCIDVGRLGVTCIECPRGLNRQIWTRGLETFATAKTTLKEEGTEGRKIKGRG